MFFYFFIQSIRCFFFKCFSVYCCPIFSPWFCHIKRMCFSIDSIVSCTLLFSFCASMGEIVVVNSSICLWRYFYIYREWERFSCSSCISDSNCIVLCNWLCAWWNIKYIRASIVSECCRNCWAIRHMCISANRDALSWFYFSDFYIKWLGIYIGFILESFRTVYSWTRSYLHAYSPRLSNTRNGVSVCYHNIACPSSCIKPSKREFKISIRCYCKRNSCNTPSRCIIFYCYLWVCRRI